MKTPFRLILPAALIVLAASCAKERIPESAVTRKFNLCIDESTRTAMSGAGDTRHIDWTDGDVLKFYTQAGQPAASSATVTVDGSGASTEIAIGPSSEFINAVYGASSLSSGSSSESILYVNSPVKALQSYTSFSQAHVCAAFCNDVDATELRFRNAAPVLTFTSASSIQKVVFYGNNGEVITGGEDGALKITYAAGSISTEAATSGGTTITVATGGTSSVFYIAVLPVEFSRGFTMDCYDGSDNLIGRQKTLKTISTVSGGGTIKVINLGNAQGWIAAPPAGAIDLGLSVKWATCNVGASNPEDPGNYYAWGETAGKSDYSWSTYAWGGSDKFTKYCPASEPSYWGGAGSPDNKTQLDLANDVANTTKGGSWRMPTDAEWTELRNNCTWAWTSDYNGTGVAGQIVTSNLEGFKDRSIFLPAAGYYMNNTLYHAAADGYYWSSSLCESSPDNAWYVHFLNDTKSRGNYARSYGFSVRPVYK